MPSSQYQILDMQPEFLVIYKQPGASFHSESGEPGLFETLRQDLAVPKLYPVHRLDKVTSGILLVATTSAANQSLVEQFRRRETEKYYLALSAHKPAKKQGKIVGDMAASRRGAWKLCHTQENPAVTQFFSKGLGNGLRLFILKPHTGKTHQLRVALKSLGAPILGDQTYGDQTLVDRTYLHAYSLAFNLAGKQYRYTQAPHDGEAFFTAEFNQALEEFAQPWLLSWPKLKATSN